ncbi:SpoIID/LytB domain-containing protein [Aminipila butyrica]|uniref:SpoIID/LytB domain-containing protein n=1 Tax=Aminipila butyrica TaxID=433296 RepID=A0A858BVT1_9FIRM|nr:SpoIID/LytB domain-containing protein [Aminipila butyrica]QIB69289.1 SpoIID/LytB domain-containing protein [Aminipila butyrica]
MKINIKKILSTTLAAVVLLTASAVYNTGTAAASSMPEYIRIGLKYGSSSTSEYQIAFDSGLRLGVGSNDGFTELASFPDVKQVTLRLEGGVVQVLGVTSSGSTLQLNQDQAGANCLMPYSDNTGGHVTFNGSTYRGGILFNVTSGSLTIINLLSVEDYLYGVINAELSRTYPAEALKTQAVAARSYAICNLGNHKSYGFDLCSTTHCQVYKGVSDEYPETIQAVDETKGETIQYDGKTVSAFFYKNSGGYTLNSQDVWGGNVGYLKAVKDEYSPVYPWSQTYTFAELSSKLSAAGCSVGTVTNVAITGRNQSGAVGTIQFSGTGGTTTLQKDKIRTVLGSTAIKSTMFTISAEGSAQPNVNTNNDANTGKAYVLPQSRTTASQLPDSVYAINSSGTTRQADIDSLYVYSTSGVKPLKDSSGSSQQPLNPSTESVSGGTVTFTGYGYGHGVGLPQDSAVEMAKKGFTYDEILQYYYTDITID